MVGCCICLSSVSCLFLVAIFVMNISLLRAYPQSPDPLYPLDDPHVSSCSPLSKYRKEWRRGSLSPPLLFTCALVMMIARLKGVASPRSWPSTPPRSTSPSRISQDLFDAFHPRTSSRLTSSGLRHPASLTHINVPLLQHTPYHDATMDRHSASGGSHGHHHHQPSSSRLRASSVGTNTSASSSPPAFLRQFEDHLGELDNDYLWYFRERYALWLRARGSRLREGEEGGVRLTDFRCCLLTAPGLRADVRFQSFRAKLEEQL